MKAMLLSAGLGRRLLPLTLTLPKPAIPVLGRPIAVQILRRLARHGFREVVLNLHHLPRAVERLVADARGEGLPEVRFSREPRILLGTGGGLRRASRWLRGEGPILVHNGDVLSDIDLPAAVEAHRRSGRAATLVLARARPGYSRVDVDGAGRVVSLAGEPAVPAETVAASYLFTGCHILEEGVLERIPAGRPSCIVRDVYRGLAREGTLGCHVHGGFWWEFGTPEAYLEGSLRLLRLPRRAREEIAAHDPLVRVGGGTVALGPGARIEGDAVVEGHAVVGSGSRIAGGAALEDCVVLPGARVGHDCRLRRVVLGPATELPDGFSLDNAVAVRHAGGGPAAPGLRRVGDLAVRSLAAPPVPRP